FSFLEGVKTRAAYEPDEAVAHVYLLQGYRFFDEALRWARHYAERYPDSLQVQLTLAALREATLSRLTDVDELVAVTSQLRRRFPNSRSAWLAHARAHIRNNNAASAQDITDQLTSRFGRCLMTDMINGWLTQNGGNYADSRRWSDRILDQQFLFAIHHP